MATHKNITRLTGQYLNW